MEEQPPSLSKTIKDLSESHCHIKAICFGDRFGMDYVTAMVYDYFPPSRSENDAEAIRILRGLIKSLGSLDEVEIEKHKEELMKFLKDKGAPLR